MSGVVASIWMFYLNDSSSPSPRPCANFTPSPARAEDGSVSKSDASGEEADSNSDEGQTPEQEDSPDSVPNVVYDP